MVMWSSNLEDLSLQHNCPRISLVLSQKHLSIVSNNSSIGSSVTPNHCFNCVWAVVQS